MKTFLLNSGLALLQDQSNNLIDKLELTGFEIGSGIGEIVDRDITDPVDQLLHVGTIDDMFITPIHTEEVLISCEINKNVLEFRPGNILLRANNGIAFLISISEHSMFKFQTSLTTVGTKLIFNIIINLPGLLDRFDFSNLSQKVATFKTFATDLDVTRWAWEEPINQIFVDNDTRTNTPAFVISSGRNFWSNPLIKNYEDFYETWGTKYPWLNASPDGLLPVRQAYWAGSLFWTGWDSPIVSDYNEYLTKVNGYETPNNHIVYNVQCQCGTIVIQGTIADTNTFSTEILWQMDDGTESNCIKIIRDPDDGFIKYLITLEDVIVEEIILGFVPLSAMFKLAVSWFEGVIRGSLNGGSVTELLGAPFTVFTFEREGSDSNDANEWLGSTMSFGRFSEELHPNILRRMSLIGENN